jgi:hypothetical protein
MSATNRLRSCLGKAEVPDLALPDQLLHCSGHVLYRHVRVNTVLVEQIDYIDPEPPEQGLGHLIIRASREKPCLGLMLKLDQREISRLMADSNLPPPRALQVSRGMATGGVTLPLLAAFQRLIDLLAEEKDIPILACHPAGNPLPSACGRSGRTSAPDCGGRKSESSDSAGNRLVES